MAHTIGDQVTTIRSNRFVPIGVTIQPSDKRPIHDQGCADADRAADEQIAMLLADLSEPCPKCGHKRTEESS